MQGCYPRSQALWNHWGRDRDPSPLTLTPHQNGSNALNQMTQTATLNPMRASIWSRTMTQHQRIGWQKTYRNLYQWLPKGVCLTRRGKNLQENFQSHRQPKLQKDSLLADFLGKRYPEQDEQFSRIQTSILAACPPLTDLWSSYAIRGCQERKVS